ncbi:MAG: acetyl-CoA acetyltransferase [Deltaproteobacteria bacterium]|nr:acetyl-CoA acetyltransferase [Deltaproteobacteria bacterium]MBW1949032.1 acetyl-CoA acetyltransferase [Deltaproteobacteria bacterium]
MPVIIGVGQYVHRPSRPGEAMDPLEMIRKAIGEAEQDAGLAGLARKIDTLCLVNILSYPPDGLPGELTRRIQASPKIQEYTWVGACAPQWFVNRTADRISSGQARLALICGGEAFYSLKLKAKDQGSKGWNRTFPAKMPWMVGDLRDPLTALEAKYGLLLPVQIYPLFENSFRYSEGLSIEANRNELGEFCSKLSAIASENPNAWFKNFKTKEEIMNPGPGNRMISFPYTKFMCSIMDVDQAAALFLADEAVADELGIPPEKRIYPIGGADASDTWHVSMRRDLHASPSVKIAAQTAMAQAKVDIDQIDFLDFYSCFPCAPRITARMLGIPKDDPRPLTITGGMPYFGGPGNNYSLHAICNMADLLRREPEKIGLVQALSWFISKHSVGIYSGVSRQEKWVSSSPDSNQDRLVAPESPHIREEGEGPATVETFTLFHDRDGEAVGGVIFGKFEDGSRCLAKLPEDRSVFQAIMSEEFVGKRGKVKFVDGFNIFRP